MNPTPTYKIGSEIITKHEEALMRELPALYPDDGEREIVERVLIPQFKALIQKVLEEFDGENGRAAVDVVIPAELPALCEKVDEAILENKVLLDVDGLFKPVFERIQEVRNEVADELDEEFKQKCRDILAEKGVHDSFELLKKGAKWFGAETFAPLRKGKSFAKCILGKPIRRMTLPVLKEIVDKLYPELSELDLMDKYRQILLDKGVKNRFDLVAKGPVWFQLETFPPFGKGSAFTAKVLGRTIIGNVSRSELKEIADKLFPMSENDLLDKYRQILLDKGVKNRFDLVAKGPVWFQLETFDPFGKGVAFASMILGRSVGSSVTKPVLEEIADILFPVSENDLLNKYRQILLEKGINNHFDLVTKKPKWFTGAPFDPFGKGNAFASRILGRTINNITVSVLKEIADKLYPELSENEVLDKYRQILLDKGIANHIDLLTRGPMWFVREPFDPFGQGKAFAKRILGRSIGKGIYFSISALKEVADKLFPEE